MIAVTNVEAFIRSQEEVGKHGTLAYFLLYLNTYMFQRDDQNIITSTNIVQSCIDNPDISIVLAHEKDILQGGCNFHTFFNYAPEVLISPPYQLVKDTAILLYSNKDYRELSLRHILCNMEAKQIGQKY